MTATRAERLFHSDFAGALGNGDEHDVHQADAADTQRQGADEGEQDLKPDGDDFELMDLDHEIKDIEGAVVGGNKSMLCAQDITYGLLDSFIVVALIAQPERVEVVSVFKVAHGGEGDVDDAIDVVIPCLHLGAKNTDDFEADAIQADVFA